MKTIFFSDVHKDIDSLERLLKQEQGNFYCLGDSELSKETLDKYKIISVKGNCDISNIPNHLIITLDDKKVLLLHGHTVDVKYDLTKLYYLTQSLDCSIAIFGHTHIVLKIEEDISFYNPGSLRDGQTYIVYENNEFIFKKLR
ncbi:MAG: YfcE family phosphodiesterase [bacterium]